MKSATKVCYLVSFILSIVLCIGYIIGFIIFMSIDVEAYARAFCEAFDMQYSEAVLASVSLTVTTTRLTFGILVFDSFCSIGVSLYGYLSYDKSIEKGSIFFPVLSIVVGAIGNVLLLISGILYLVDLGTRKKNQPYQA